MWVGLAKSLLGSDETMKMHVTVLVLAAGLCRSVVSQTCPSYTAGYTGTTYLHDSSAGMLYVNEASSHRAQCDGTVYRWHYCYYDAQSLTNLEVAFGAYRAEYDDDDLERYHLRDGSYYLLHLDSREGSFTCDTVELDEANYFQIYENDRLGACMRNTNNAEFLDILAEEASNSKVGMWGSSSGRCRESDMSSSDEEPDIESGKVLHLYVDINIDECSRDLDNCHDTLATCTDEVGGDNSFACACIPGYTGDGVSCTNVDECQLELDACFDNADCIDNQGSYVCTCPSGFRGDGVVDCNNIDECAEGSHTCDALASCTDTLGSYTCVCSSGYTGNGETCSDINECETGTDSCDVSAECTNTDGSYTCSCTSGYSGDGMNCSDINECTIGVCSENAGCTNSDGSFMCRCLLGFSGDGLVCSDINECDDGTSSCDMNTECTNTDGSYTCSCTPGYSGDGMNCSDIDECQTGDHNCGAVMECINNEGSFSCVCPAGYQLSGPQSCQDLDECAKDHTCDTNAVCNNIEGSYNCECMAGYSGDGTVCEEILMIDQTSEDARRSAITEGVAAVLAVLGTLTVITLVVIVAVCIIRKTKVFSSYRKKNVASGISNAVYVATECDAVRIDGVNIDIYDYPTLSSMDAKPPLEFYSTAEYSEMITFSHDEYSMEKACNSASDYEVPYYSPANQEEELCAQLRREKIKAITKDEIEIAVRGRLGGGEFGDVVKGYWKSADYSVEVALKTLSGAQTREGRTKLLQEAAIMSQFKHPNVVKLFGVVIDRHELMLVIELLKKGDLRQFLLTMKPDPGELVSPQTPMMLLNFSQQIAVGLQYLSRKNFIHRDLAARNVLVSYHNICKIGDFGMARNLIEDDYYTSQGGKIPLKWTAPEALVYRKYSTASDVWSYGCVLYEIWSLGHKPFESMTNQEVLRQVELGHRLPPPPGCPRVIYDIMIHCWNPQSSDRPAAGDIIVALMANEEAVLRVPKADAATTTMAGVLGGPLEAGKDMYPDLQGLYCTSQY